MNETSVSTASPLLASPRAPEAPRSPREEPREGTLRAAARPAPSVEELDKYDISTLACTD